MGDLAAVRPRRKTRNPNIDIRGKFETQRTRSTEALAASLTKDDGSRAAERRTRAESSRLRLEWVELAPALWGELN